MDKSKLVPVLFVIAGLAIGGFLTIQVSDNTVYYYTVSEALAQDSIKPLRISGYAKAGSIDES